jgi:formylglycine-generating enzyme required for sulfatase activity
VTVDSFMANAWGLYNVRGNVWEWTEDCWNVNNSGNPSDGSARATGDCDSRAIRGGSWFGDPGDLRAAIRLQRRYYITRFRVAKTL